jgi:ABC-type multidrug transport system ATPase subunit
MKRRVNLALSLMNRPELLFPAEPALGVDPTRAVTSHIFDIIEGLGDAGMTVL